VSKSELHDPPWLCHHAGQCSTCVLVPLAG
jgi:hypothetical protein